MFSIAPRGMWGWEHCWLSQSAHLLQSRVFVAQYLEVALGWING